MNKRDNIIYYAATGLFSALIGMGVVMYFAQHEMVSEMFTSLGFPTWIIYPLAIAKTLGLVAIWTNKSKMLKEWAYAGFVFDLLLAISAHTMVGDGGQGGAIVALLLVVVSYIFNRKKYPTYQVG